MNFRDIAKAQVKIDEGKRLKPYRCTAGKLSIGYGRNLDDEGISQDEADYLLTNDLNRAEGDARVLFPRFDTLSDNRKAVLINMSLNLGRGRLAGFKKFRAAVHEGDFERAAAEMLHSSWALQVGRRAERLSKQMKEG